MITELLEKFEDIFTPLPDKEAAKRFPKGTVKLVTDIYHTFGDGRNFNTFTDDPLSVISHGDIGKIKKGTILFPWERLEGVLPNDVIFVTSSGFFVVNPKPEWYKLVSKSGKI